MRPCHKVGAGGTGGAAEAVEREGEAQGLAAVEIGQHGGAGGLDFGVYAFSVGAVVYGFAGCGVGALVIFAELVKIYRRNGAVDFAAVVACLQLNEAGAWVGVGAEGCNVYTIIHDTDFQLLFHRLEHIGRQRRF